MKILILSFLLVVLYSCANESPQNTTVDTNITINQLSSGDLNILQQSTSVNNDLIIVFFKISNISSSNGRIRVNHNSSFSYINSSCDNNIPKILKINHTCDYKIAISKSVPSGNYPITIIVSDAQSNNVIHTFFTHHYIDNPTDLPIENSSLCKAGFHFESRVCKTDIKPASLTYLTTNNALTGYQLWNPSISSYETILTVCANGYNLINNSCVSGNVAYDSSLTYASNVLLVGNTTLNENISTIRENIEHDSNLIQLDDNSVLSNQYLNQILQADFHPNSIFKAEDINLKIEALNIEITKLKNQINNL